MIIFLFIITLCGMNSTISLHIDVLVNQGEINCDNNLICQQSLSPNLSATWHVLQAKDVFLRARTVKTFVGDLVVEASPRACVPTFLEHIGLDINNICFHQCMDLFKGRCPLFLQRVYNKSWYQRIYRHNQSSIHARDSFLSVLRVIIQRENVSTIIIIIQDSHQKLEFFNFLPVSLSYVILVVDEAGNFSHPGLLKDLHSNIREENLNVIVVCNSGCIRHIVQQVYELEVEISRTRISKLSRWLFIPVEGDLEDILLKDLPHSQAADMFIVHFQHCQQIYHSLDYHTMAENWSVLHTTNTTRKDPKGHVDYINSERGRVADVYSMYNTNQGQRLRLKAIITSDYRETNTKSIFDSVRHGYNNKTFVVGMLEWPPFVYKVNNSGEVTYEGLSVDLLEELSRRLNFSYVYKEPSDGEWGRILNRSWTGLVGEIAQGKFDLVATPLTISYARERVMDFTQPYFYIQSLVIVSKQDPNTRKWLTLINPFRWEVHTLVVLSLFVSTIFLFVVEEINPMNHWTNNRLTERQRRYGDILWYHFGALMANGGAYLPMTQSGRSVIACWWLLTVMVAAIYSGNLIAFLTDNREHPPFTTLSEMVAQSEFKWGVLGGSAIVTLFQESKRSDYRQIWEGVEKATVTDPDIQSLNLDVHLRKLNTEKYAYIGDSTTWELWHPKSCNLMALNERFYPMTYGIGLPNNSVNTKVFSNQLLSIQESGLIPVWQQKWQQRPHCQGPSHSAKRVDLMALQSAFYAAGIGVLCALLVLLNEVAYNRTCKQKRYTECCSNNTCMGWLQQPREQNSSADNSVTDL